MAGCAPCQAMQLRAVAPGEAGPFPLWAKMLIAAGFLGTIVLVGVALKQAR